MEARRGFPTCKRSSRKLYGSYRVDAETETVSLTEYVLLPESAIDSAAIDSSLNIP